MKLHDVFFVAVSDNVQRQNGCPTERSFWKSGGTGAVEREKERWWQSGLVSYWASPACAYSPIHPVRMAYLKMAPARQSSRRLQMLRAYTQTSCVYAQPIATGSNQSAGSPLVKIVLSSEMNARSLPPYLSLFLEQKMLLNPGQSKKGLGGQVSSLNCGSLHSSSSNAQRLSGGT